MVTPLPVKYGLIADLPTFAHLSSSSLHNIGDNIQSHAVEHLYHHMGIGQESIVKLNRYQFSSYDGRDGYVLMPMCAYFTLGNAHSPFPLSPFIIPVYFSFGLSTDVDDPALLAHFRRYEPIATRDERVMQMFRQRDVAAFVFGCLTIIFPYREALPGQDKVFLVDIPDDLLPYIPAHLMQRAETATHIYPYLKAPADDDECERLDQIARQQCQRYAREAALVVTSRLHCATVCLAMGIPTIVVGCNISDRFAWLDRYVKIYAPDDFAEIDWSPQSLDLGTVKTTICAAAAQQIESARSKWGPLAEISAFYEARNRSSYNNLMREALEKALALSSTPKGTLRFAFWGATTHGVRLSRALQEMRPRSELILVIDEFVESKSFCGVAIRRSDALPEIARQGVFVFIATYAGRSYAEAKLRAAGVAYTCLFGDLLTYHALS